MLLTRKERDKQIEDAADFVRSTFDGSYDMFIDPLAIQMCLKEHEDMITAAYFALRYHDMANAAFEHGDDVGQAKWFAEAVPATQVALKLLNSYFSEQFFKEQESKYVRTQNSESVSQSGNVPSLS
jgi:hypothetical protein